LSKKIVVRFFKTEAGNEPVKDWLLSLDWDSKKIIGNDIKTAEYGWPIGMPLIRKFEGQQKLWEVRSNIKDGIVRIIFTIDGELMILLHGFIKKSQKTEKKDIDLAVKRRKDILGK
jgi:phage-related protein